MTVNSALARARAFTESRLMQDVCAVTRGTSDPVFNPGTGEYEPGSEPIYGGKCRVQAVRAQAANPEAGGAVFTVEPVELQLPFGVVLAVGDIAEVTESMNPALVGNRYRVTGLGEKTHPTAARYNVEVTD